MSRPGSPQERAPYFDDAYCAVCKCSHCQYLSSSSCPKCTCASCIDQPEAAYDPADDDQKPARKVAKSRGGRSAVFDTPKKRAKTASQTPTDSRNLAIEAAKSAAPYTMPPGVSRCCLVSLRYAEADCLQTCHILPRSLQPEILTALERAWNLPSQTLNIHSRYNMITLTPELHASFDKGSWALVPLSTHLLYRFLNYKHPITALQKRPNL
ncbi:hypothetical protein BDZ97DRAFT_1054354 [Flammula alnicola]|nr:hypothetical protein BDZ97DRAFT_1054354 [Flammula alnicola]